MPVALPIPPPVAGHRILTSSSSSSAETTHTLDTIDIEKGDHAAFQTLDRPPSQPDPVLSDQYMLPEKRPRPKRAWALPTFSTHRRLITIMVLINLALLGLALGLRWWDNLPALGYLTIGNITLAVIVRQQRFINLLFKLAILTKTALPLPIRWALGKIYHFGGLHSGAGVSATVWMLLFTVAATYLRVSGSTPGPSELLLFLTYVIDLLLVGIVVLALPRFRSRFHNSFEASHRFLGWTLLLLVWIHSFFLIRDYTPNDQSLVRAFFTSVSPYLLMLITLSIASPWFYLRKVPVKTTKPSDHVVIMQFEEGVRPAFPGSSSAISVSPLYEWHSFANIPKPGEAGFRLVISRVGDWTSGVIDKPPSHVWMKGIPTAGVANIEKLFHRVLYVCTGSGIGPVLPHLLAKEVPSQLFWSTRTPVDTYGEDLVKEIMESSPDAVVHDTTVLGKPDMVATSHKMAVEGGAEAVIVISNQKLTRKVVYGMESRGIPAFGAIWDS